MINTVIITVNRAYCCSLRSRWRVGVVAGNGDVTAFSDAVVDDDVAALDDDWLADVADDVAVAVWRAVEAEAESECDTCAVRCLNPPVTVSVSVVIGKMRDVDCVSVSLALWVSIFASLLSMTVLCALACVSSVCCVVVVGVGCCCCCSFCISAGSSGSCSVGSHSIHLHQVIYLAVSSPHCRAYISTLDSF